MNWVDRRFARERNLEDVADVWNKAMASIHDACTSFEKKNGETQIVPQNGHRVLIEIKGEQHQMSNVFVADPTRRVVITLNEADPAIITTLDAEPAKQFRIEADETHSFLKWGGSEISFDEFSRLALEDAFFKPKQLPPARRRARVGNWS